MSARSSRSLSENVAAVEQQTELQSAEAPRRLDALDPMRNGVREGLGEHKRDLLKLREEVNGPTVKNALHEVDIQKNSIKFYVRRVFIMDACYNQKRMAEIPKPKAWQ